MPPLQQSNKRPTKQLSPQMQQQRRRKQSVNREVKREHGTSPLDLSKTQSNNDTDDPDADENDGASNGVSPRSARSTTPVEKVSPPKEVLQQRDIEAHLNLLKMKHLEFLKTQQQQQQQALVGGGESRCEECNINFARHQNYVAHKKYYCSSGAKPHNKALLPITEDADDASSSGRKRKSSSPVDQQPKPLPVSAALGILGMAAAAQQQQPTPAHELLGKEMLLLKQQQDLLLKSDLQQVLTRVEGTPAPPAPPPLTSLLLPPPPLTMQSPQKSPSKTTASASGNSGGGGSISPNHSSSSPSPTPPSAAAVAVAAAVSGHFVCEGCGIKFKSVTNLQAHQARYCAGMRKPSDDMASAFEAIVKRSQQQPPMLSAADMMSFLNAKSLEQQAKAAVAAAAAAAAATATSNEGMKEKSQSPGEDFCCILCGYKEQSVDRLKDHINMHFIGQVKKSQTSTSQAGASSSSGSVGGSRDDAKGEAADASPGSKNSSSPPVPKTEPLESHQSSSPSSVNVVEAQPPLRKRIKAELEAEESGRGNKETKCNKNGSPRVETTTEPASSSIRCEPCDIGFAHLSNFVAHKKYYCRGQKDKNQGAAATNGNK